MAVDIFLVYGVITVEEYDKTGKVTLRKKDVERQFAMDHMGG